MTLNEMRKGTMEWYLSSHLTVLRNEIVAIFFGEYLGGIVLSFLPDSLDLEVTSSFTLEKWERLAKEYEENDGNISFFNKHIEEVL